MSDAEYAREVLRYSNARMVLTCRERGMRNAPIHPEVGLPNDFTEVDVQALAAHLREVWGTRPHAWSPESENPETGSWVRLPDDPDELIEVLDRHASMLADRMAWEILRSLYNPKKGGTSAKPD